MDLPLEGLRILVVEDHREVRELLCLFLDGHGARTLCVSSAIDAIDKLPGFAPDVLLADVNMPVVDGCDLLRTLREHGHDVPAVAITGDHSAHQRARVREAGFVDCVLKPFDWDRLLGALRAVGARDAVERRAESVLES
jgi:CheY-like chemotaxis protein